MIPFTQQDFVDQFPKGQDLLYEKNIIPHLLEIIQENKLVDLTGFYCVCTYERLMFCFTN
jgi:hypothetical protein